MKIDLGTLTFKKESSFGNKVSGNESMLQSQIGDPFTDTMDAISTRIIGLAKKENSITGKEYDSIFNSISKDFEKATRERFGISIELRRGNTYMVMPIYNEAMFATVNKTLSKDAKRAKKQNAEFRRWLDDNTLLLDMKNARVVNFPKHMITPIYIDVNDWFKPRELSGIIMHEIGHVFTLLELYSLTIKTTSRLLEDFASNKDINKTIDTLGMGGDGESKGITNIYSNLNHKIKMLDLGQHGVGETNSEHEADEFATKFGYGAELTTILSNSVPADKLGVPLMVKIDLVFTVLRIISIALLLSITSLTSLGTGFVIAFYVELLLLTKFIGKEIYTHISSRNPNNDVHGSMLERLEAIKTSVLKQIRIGANSKQVTYNLISSYDTIVSNIELVESSGIGSFMMSHLVDQFRNNMNLEDQLAKDIDSLINNEMFLQQARLSTLHGNESIDYQGTDPVVPKLNNFFAKLRNRGVISNTLNYIKSQQELVDIVYNRFGIPIFPMPAISFGTGWACIPYNFVSKTGISDWKKYFSKKSISVGNMRNWLVGLIGPSDIMDIYKNTAIDNLANDLNQGLKLEIDLKRAKIKGLKKGSHESLVFIEYGRDMFGLSTIDAISLTPEEMTAVFLHEIGHLFTHIEAMQRTVTTTIALQDSFLKIKGTPKFTVESKEEVVNDLKDNSGSLIYIKTAITQVLMTPIVMLDNIVFDANGGLSKKLLSQYQTENDRLGSFISMSTNSELLADDFSVNLGTGADLVRGLNKLVTLNIKGHVGLFLPILINNFAVLVILSRNMFMNGDIPKALEYILKRLVRAMLYITGFYAMWSIVRVITGEALVYERLPERFDGVKRTLIKGLRGSDLSSRDKKNLLEQIHVIEEIHEQSIQGGYGSLLMSIFFPQNTVGTDTSLEVRLTDGIDKLLNNDLYVKQLEFEQLAEGNEAIEHISDKLPEPSIYYTSTQIASPSLADLLFSNKKDSKQVVERINEILVKYNILLMVDDINTEEVKVRSNRMLSIGRGYTSIVFYDDKTSVTITLDPMKPFWLLENPYINVYTLDNIKANEFKTLYIFETETLKPSKDATYNALNKVAKLVDRFYKEQGEGDLIEALGKFKEYMTDGKIKVNKDLLNQIELLEELSKTNELLADPYTWLDLHDGNVKLNKKNKPVLFDPIVNRKVLASRVVNYVDLDRSNIVTKK